jgi:predicted RNA binding protein YcfA (HicA-like mRNA interferase family)
VKHTDLVRMLESMGCVLIRHGAKHDWYQNPATEVSQPVPRHHDIADGLAGHILKMMG